ncbi:MAG: HflX-like GTP-binding protein, partial [Candidatus Hodarchaeales archaeon]
MALLSKKEIRPFAVAIYIQEDREPDGSDEFFALIRSAGYEIHPKIFKQPPYFSSRMFLSPGRIQEISMFLEEENDRKIAVIVVSQELSPRQA